MQEAHLCKVPVGVFSTVSLSNSTFGNPGHPISSTPALRGGVVAAAPPTVGCAAESISDTVRDKGGGMAGT